MTRFSLLSILFFFAGCASIAATPSVAPAEPQKSEVYYMTDDSSITDYQDDPEVVHKMVDYVVMATTETNDVASAWRSLVKPGDRVGIKISAAGGKFFSSHKSVVEAIVEGLESAGIARKDIIVWDREGLAAAGYTNHEGGYQVRSIESGEGYDPEAVIFSGILGKLIWGDLDFAKRDLKQRSIVPQESEQLSQDSHLCRILSHDVTKVINVPVLSTSESCGIAGCLYNMTVPNVDNWRRFGGNDSFICDLYSDERIGKKVVINIMDGLLAQYAGGPEFQPNYLFRHASIYASKDPVALDTVALAHIEQWRSQGKLPRIAPRAAYLPTASQMGLGAVKGDQIDLREIRPR